MSTETEENVDASSVYVTFMPLVRSIASMRFHVPRQDAEDLSQGVIISYLRRRVPPDDVRHWMVGAAVLASRYYWRKRKSSRESPVPPNLEELADESLGDMADRLCKTLDCKTVIKRLTSTCQKYLVMRYRLGMNDKEIAAEMGLARAANTSQRVLRCKRKFLELWLGMTRARRV